jgi:hypothetical protein
LEHQLDLAPHLEAGQLDVERVAGIAVVAAADADGYAATGHLLGLLAALPAPTKAGERFWSVLWRSSGTAYLLPVKIKAPALRSLAGEGTALARHERRRLRPGGWQGPQRRRPPGRGVRDPADRSARSGHVDVLGLRTLLALGDVERHGLALPDGRRTWSASCAA